MSAFSNDREPNSSLGIDTIALHGSSPDPWCHALITPLVQSTTFAQEQVGAPGYAYSRVSNPTVDALERELGAIENAPPAVTFSTGLAAETALFFTLLQQGDHAVVGSGIYGGTVRLFRQVLSKLGITATFVNTANLDEIAAAITPKTKIVFIETPTNPTLELADIPAIAAIAKRAGVKLVVDNTFLTPVIQRPLDLGADISVVSTTKHIEGHSTALGGAVTSRDENFLTQLRFYRKATGAIQTPFQAFLTSRGLKTLPLRLRQHSENALEVAQWLERHPSITRVNYPGLYSFPQRELALRQHKDTKGRILHGGVISFEVEGGVEAGRALLNNVKLCTLVEHVGSVETLLTHPATMTHADVPREQRLAAGITDGLIRISVGLEDPKDILADLERAISIATANSLSPKAVSAAPSPAAGGGGGRVREAGGGETVPSQQLPPTTTAPTKKLKEVARV